MHQVRGMKHIGSRAHQHRERAEPGIHQLLQRYVGARGRAASQGAAMI